MKKAIWLIQIGISLIGVSLWGETQVSFPQYMFIFVALGFVVLFIVGIKSNNKKETKQ